MIGISISNQGTSVNKATSGVGIEPQLRSLRAKGTIQTILFLPSSDVFGGPAPNAWAGPWASDAILGMLVPLTVLPNSIFCGAVNALALVPFQALTPDPLLTLLHMLLPSFWSPFMSA